MDDLILVTEAFEYHCKNLEGVTKTHYRKKSGSPTKMQKIFWKKQHEKCQKKWFNNVILTYQSIFGVIEL